MKANVSVVIATYNRAAQVKEAIDSVLDQSLPVREVIVVDDGSKDNTRAQLEAYGDRIRAFFRPNGGASAARNYGMRMATGEWIAFLDDDDVWAPTKIERQMELATRNPELGLIYCSDYAVDEQLRILYTREALSQNRGDVFERLLIKNFIFTSCVIARRGLVEKAGYMDLRFKFAQDWDLWLKIAANHPADFVAEPLVLYRQSASGCLTRDMKAADRLAEMQTIFEEGLALRKASRASERKGRYELERQWASTWLEQGKNSKALPHSARVISARPGSLEGYRLFAYSLVPKKAREWAKQIVRRKPASPQNAAAQYDEATTNKKIFMERSRPRLRRKNLLKRNRFPEAVAPEKPPVIIMNMFYSGLAIARDMAGTGVRVIGLSADRNAYGNFTRFCEVRSAPDSQSQPGELVKYLVNAASDLRGAVIFPTRDADVVFLDRYRDELKDYRLALPSQSSLSRVLDKGALVEAAQAASVPVPRTFVVRAENNLSLVAEKVGFPCVVKPVSSYQWRGEGKWEAVGCRKAFRADTLEHLQEEYARVASVNPEVLVQEWIPGPSTEITIMGGYFGQDSEALGYFCARKLVQEPDDFGTGCVVQNLALDDLVAPSIRLCKALNYRGMAEIEYKRDINTGEYKLIEINTRHWDWHQLARMSGVNLTRVAYSDLTGCQLDAATPQKQGGKWIAEDALLLHSASGILRRKTKLRTLMRQLAGPRMFGIFSWKDPMPFLRHSFMYMLPRMSRMGWQKIRHKA